MWISHDLGQTGLNRYFQLETRSLQLITVPIGNSFNDFLNVQRPKCRGVSGIHTRELQRLLDHCVQSLTLLMNELAIVSHGIGAGDESNGQIAGEHRDRRDRRTKFV